MKELNIWFICIGEPIPQNNNFENLHRCGTFAYNFSKNGHKVKWVTSDFDHFSKKNLKFNQEMILSENFKISFLNTKPYKKNISFSRFYSHYLIGNELKKSLKSISNKPDIIYASYPTIEMAYESVKYAKKNDIPIIVDIRDLWPDIFLSAIPNFLHIFAKAALWIWYMKKRFIFEHATSIIGISEGYLNFAFKESSRNKSKWDKVVYKSYNSSFKNKSNMVDKFRAIYIGAISRNKTNLELVINTFNSLGLNYELIICGDGDDIDFYKSISNENIIFKGWTSKSDLKDIIEDCQLGVVPLNNRFDFKLALVNKAIEYLSYGLPIASSLDGDLKQFIRKYKNGISYSNGEELKDFILNISKDKNYHKKLSENAIYSFEKNFDFEKNFLKVENHFQLLAKK